MNEPYKPLCLTYPEAEKEIFDVITSIINRHGLPLFIVEIILNKALRQVEDGAMQERAMAQQMYEEALKDYIKEKDDDGNNSCIN